MNVRTTLTKTEQENPMSTEQPNINRSPIYFTALKPARARTEEQGTKCVPVCELSWHTD